MRVLLVSLSAILMSLASAVRAETGPLGDWLTAGASAIVRVAPCGDKLCGRIVWLWEPRRADGQPMRDDRNTDPALRARPLIGLEMLAGFRPGAAGEWAGGRIYNPEDGSTYSATLTVRDTSTLDVRGCVLFICRSQIWRRPSALPR